jgi:hypothetical protein
MNDVTIQYNAKYLGLTEGFLYRNGVKHPNVDWMSKVDVAAIASSIDILDSEYEEKLQEALVLAYKQAVREVDKPNTVGWYDWIELENSIN